MHAEQRASKAAASCEKQTISWRDGYCYTAHVLLVYDAHDVTLASVADSRMGER